MANVVEDLLTRQFNTNPAAVERWILLGILRSLRFYRTCRGKLCPPLTDGRLRQDFLTQRYNHLYAAVNRYWRLLDRAPANQDMEAPKHLIQALLQDDRDQGRLTEHDHQQLVAELDTFFYGSPTVAPEVIQGLHNPLKVWLDLRMATMALNASYLDAQTRRLSMTNLNETIGTYRRAANMEETRVVNPAGLLDARRIFYQRIATSLPDLNVRLGGGFGRGEVALVASANGGGKTVFGCQQAVYSTQQGLRVAYFTTEQTPLDLTYRMLSNRANVDLKYFTNREELRVLDRVQMLELETLPSVFRSDPGARLGLKAFQREVAPRLGFMDWANGAAPIVQDAFEPAMDVMAENLGGAPELVIFDWIGGAMEHGKDKEHLRHYYYDAVNFLVNYAKSHPSVAIIVMAQINKVAAERAHAIKMVHLAECKAMSDNVTVFIGISSLNHKTKEGELTVDNPADIQCINVQKARSGKPGAVAVLRQFQYQRFAPWAARPTPQ